MSMPIKSSYNQSSPAGVAVPKLGQKIRSTYGTVSSPMQFLSDLGIFATVDPLCFNPLICEADVDPQSFGIL